jgi:hypothetical protein
MAFTIPSKGRLFATISTDNELALPGKVPA